MRNNWLDTATTYELQEELERRGYTSRWFRSPYNTLRYQVAYRDLYDNIDRIPIEEIERLNEKYGL